jgi:hypothetical protein
VTFRKDGVTLINGKPFFMIAHWWFTRRGDKNRKNCNWWYDNPEDRGNDMDFLREAGFNTVLVKRGGFNDLDLGLKHGMKIMVEPPHVLAGETEEARKTFKKNYQQQIKKHLKHPAFFGYFGPDEVMLNGRWRVEVLLKASEMIWEVDPFHPIFYNEAPCGTVAQQREFAVIGNVIGRDIYPVGASHGDLVSDRAMTAVGKHTDICHASVDNNKPVWMILQALAWKHIHVNNRTLPYEKVKARYPTYAENRFMAYNAIVHGATGIMYHYLGYTIHVPDSFWRDLRKVTLELEYLSPVYTAPTVMEPAMKCSDKGIRFLTKNYQGKNYYLIINESAKPVNARFSSCPEKSLNTLFEDGKILPDNGRFNLEFAPYDVKVLSEASFESGKKIFKPETYVPYSKQPILKGKK